MNTYSYVYNNPVKLYDIFGLDTFGLGINLPHSDAVSNGILNPNIDPGHTYTYIKNDQGVKTHSVSFGPESPINKGNLDDFSGNGVPGRADYPLSGEIKFFEWNISPTNLSACKTAFNQFSNNPPLYSKNTQCTSVSTELAEQCGFKLPNGSSPIYIPSVPFIFKGFRGNLPNPYGLHNQL